ncbi:cation:proton antiporter [Mesorhizobium sp. L2C066B000]|uniref:cation:proton antiporter n=1 Tax=Mesorhizobium sp. L2C066B000 TaxID=1287105 RepID=UPI000B2AD77C
MSFVVNRRRSVALAAAAFAFMPAASLAAEKTGMSSEGIFVLEILLLLLVGRGIGELLERLGQPAVMGQLIGGILLGPSLLGWLLPEAERVIFSGDATQKSMISAIAQLGVLMLLLLTGMETDLRLVRRVGRACFSISAAGVAVPFALGFTAAQLMPASLLADGTERIVAGLFLGTALSISSVKIVAMVVREMNFMRRDLGQIIVSSAIIEDTIGWVIIAITIGHRHQGAHRARQPCLHHCRRRRLHGVFLHDWPPHRFRRHPLDQRYVPQRIRRRHRHSRHHGRNGADH